MGRNATLLLLSQCGSYLYESRHEKPVFESKGADQLRGYSATDLCLCFRICK